MTVITTRPGTARAQRTTTDADGLFRAARRGPRGPGAGSL